MAKQRRVSLLPIPLVQTTSMELVTVRLVTDRAHPQLCILPHVVRCISAYSDFSQSWTLETASDAGYLSLLDRVRPKEWTGVSKELRVTRFLRAISHAAANGRVDILNWWRTQYLPTEAPEETKAVIVRIAAFHGHLNVLEWLLSGERGLQTVTRMSRKLICQDPEVVLWIHNHSRRARLLILLDSSIERGDVEFLDWVHSHRSQHQHAFSTDAVDSAAEAGDLQVLQWLYEHEDNWQSERAMYCATKAGHLDVLRWLESTCSDTCNYKLPGR